MVGWLLVLLKVPSPLTLNLRDARLALSLEKTPTTLFLLTRTEAQRPLSLPVAMRLELENLDPDRLVVRVAKEKFGRVASPRQIAWTRPDGVPRSSRLSGAQ